MTLKDLEYITLMELAEEQPKEPAWCEILDVGFSGDQDNPLYTAFNHLKIYLATKDTQLVTTNKAAYDIYRRLKDGVKNCYKNEKEEGGCE